MTDLKPMVYGVDYFVDWRQLYNPQESSLRYVKADIAWIEAAYNSLRPPKPKKVRHVSAFRTISDRKWAGFKANKPKHNWGKKRKRRGGWKV